jgi:hypothetical protein
VVSSVIDLGDSVPVEIGAVTLAPVRVMPGAKGRD